MTTTAVTPSPLPPVRTGAKRHRTAKRQQGREEGVQQGLRHALERLLASGMAEDQARRLLGLE